MKTLGCNRCGFETTLEPGQDGELAAPVEEQLAAHAEASGHPLCTACAGSLRVTDQAVCEGCLTGAQDLLAGILLMYFHDLADVAGNLRGSGLSGGRPGASDGQPVPGGDATVLMGPGSQGLAEDGFTSRDGDPSSVAFDLGFWEQAWRDHFGEPGPVSHRPKVTVSRAAGYLERRNRQAAHSHAGYPDYLDDLRLLHERLLRVTGRALKPSRANAACFDCGRPLLKRDVEDRGLEEHFTCVGCHRTYDDVAYALAQKRELLRQSSFEVEGLTFESRELVAARLSRPVNTIRKWMSQQIVRSHLRAGIRYVCLADAVAEDERRQRKARRIA